MSRRVPSSSSSSIRPSVPSSVPSSSSVLCPSVLCPSVHVRPSSSSVLCPSVPSSVPSSSSVLCPSVHVRPSSLSLLCPPVPPCYQSAGRSKGIDSRTWDIHPSKKRRTEPQETATLNVGALLLHSGERPIDGRCNRRAFDSSVATMQDDNASY